MKDPAPNFPPRHPSKGQAGGIFIVIGLLAGAIIGIAYNEPSLGMVTGLGAGCAAAIAIWLIDRRRG